MEENILNNLKEALQVTPDNIPLKLYYADVLLKADKLEEAEKQYIELLAIYPDKKFEFGLAKTYFAKGEYSKCNVILEEVIARNEQDFDITLLYTKALVKEGEVEKAVGIYKHLVSEQPDFRDEELDSMLRLYASGHSSETNEESGVYIQKPSFTFKDVGGMDNVKKQIDLKIIKPISHPELYKAYGKKIGGGILLYGPPGCGKTFIAKATAGEVTSRFISVGLNDILDMWIGNSEKNLHQVFEVARQNTPCVLFFDEIDALGASRNDMKQSGGRRIINQFLHELDGVDNTNEGILVIGATNTPWNLDSAFRRPGRFDRIIFVPPPDDDARESILKIKLKERPTGTVDYKSVAKKLEHFSGADIEALIDIVVEEKLELSFTDGILKHIDTKDLINAIKKHKPSTQEWFATAKNFALFANDTGLYDEILFYMKIKK